MNVRCSLDERMLKGLKAEGARTTSQLTTDKQ